MSLPWFRMYAEWASDPVVQSLAFEDQRHYAVLLCLKCNGTLDRRIELDQRERIILRGLGLDPVSASEAKRRLLEVGLINDKWQPKGWDKRQYASDVSTNRVRNFRKNKQSGNVSETLQETLGNGFGNAPEQIQNRTDTEQKIFIGIHTNTGLEFAVFNEQISEWESLFPAVDVRQELRNMRAWSMANKVKRKTAGGMPKFINTWLTKAQNESRGNAHGTHQRIDNSAPAKVQRAIDAKRNHRQAINGESERVE